MYIEDQENFIYLFIVLFNVTSTDWYLITVSQHIHAYHVKLTHYNIFKVNLENH